MSHNVRDHQLSLHNMHILEPTTTLGTRYNDDNKQLNHDSNIRNHSITPQNQRSLACIGCIYHVLFYC